MNAENLRTIIIVLGIAASAFNGFLIIAAVVHMIQNKTMLNIRECTKDIIEALTWELILIGIVYAYITVMPVVDNIIGMIMKNFK